VKNLTQTNKFVRSFSTFKAKKQTNQHLFGNKNKFFWITTLTAVTSITVVSAASNFDFHSTQERKIGTTSSTSMSSHNFEIKKTEDQWKASLSKDEFHVIREKGTERAGTGEYDKFYPKEGHFACRACGNPLYSASSKFNSGCGWPAFDKCYTGSVAIEVDSSFGMRRVEIMCAKCGGHLGHVFEGEHMTSTNERHCVNSVSVKYVKEKSPTTAESKVVSASTTTIDTVHRWIGV